ncbi:hypothetical protein NEHOM01_2114 [Nematocida homosporus]|uniref:uncharacterized protein n=1 Tax=Nematocida homosporus TaxID=1912981 RepID=UPI002220FEE7|nr:uncharacterized protein NEHOM01_2114 [Nematocida homosporus]KAI5187352.1 hypothetical protein NEHOM01_2114 [Nematocida homosporus]
MKLLQRISQLLLDTENDRNQIEAATLAYLQTLSRQSQKRRLLVISQLIEDFLVQTPAPNTLPLTISEKQTTIILLNKRLAQINNTTQKANWVANFVITHALNTLDSTKLESFLDLLIDRLLEQIKAQVAPHSKSAPGYAYFILAINQQIPRFLPLFKRRLFTQALAPDCLLAAYRVYFWTLQTPTDPLEPWAFIAALLNETSEINNSYNPGVLYVFLDVLNEYMSDHFNPHWSQLIQTIIIPKYLPLINPQLFPTEICQIKQHLNVS